MTELQLDYLQDIFADLEDTSRRSATTDFGFYCQWSAGAFQSKGAATCEEQDIDSVLATQMESAR